MLDTPKSSERDRDLAAYQLKAAVVGDACGDMPAWHNFVKYCKARIPGQWSTLFWDKGALQSLNKCEMTCSDLIASGWTPEDVAAELEKIEPLVSKESVLPYLKALKVRRWQGPGVWKVVEGFTGAGGSVDSTMHSVVIHASRKAIRRLTEGRKPSEGIYYIVQIPEGWRLLAYPYHGDMGALPEIDHAEYWESDVVPYLSYIWAKHLGQHPMTQRVLEKRIAKSLGDAYTGFPRGRVSKKGTRYIVHNGNNLMPGMPTRSQVERAFEIQGVCEWEFDSHERCLSSDVEAVCSALLIQPRWKATE